MSRRIEAALVTLLISKFQRVARDKRSALFPVFGDAYFPESYADYGVNVSSKELMIQYRHSHHCTRNGS